MATNNKHSKGTAPLVQNTFLDNVSNPGVEEELDIKVTFDAPGFSGIVKKMRGPIKDYQGGTGYKEEYYAVLLMTNEENKYFPTGDVVMARYLAIHSDLNETSVGTIMHANGKANIDFMTAECKYTEVIVTTKMDETHAWINLNTKHKRDGYDQTYDSGGSGVGRPHYGENMESDNGVRQTLTFL